MAVMTCERPGASDSGPRETISLGKLINTENRETPTDLQARHLRLRFGLSSELARCIATLAFAVESPR